MDVVCGDRTSETGLKLWHKIAHRGQEADFITDYWEPYEEFLPPDRHIKDKAETFTVEGLNSVARHFLARLRRRTKCYSKSQQMLELSLQLLILKRNKRLSILS